jgi:hypothetical protein
VIERNIVEKPEYISASFEGPQIEKNNELFEYILSGLK